MAANAPPLEEFEGNWTLLREISDRRADTRGRLNGHAVFTPETGGGLRYAETGSLSYADQPPVTATRSYVWRPGNDAISVLFDDERPFHRIETTKLMPDAMHHCVPDMYHVSYDFTAWPIWSTAWRVVGPAKDYRMVSRYLRVT